MKYPVVIEKDEDGIYVVECPIIPGCISQGMSEEEAIENIKEAIKQCLEVRHNLGLPLFLEMTEIEVS